MNKINDLRENLKCTKRYILDFGFSEKHWNDAIVEIRNDVIDILKNEEAFESSYFLYKLRVLFFKVNNFKKYSESDRINVIDSMIDLL